MRQKYFFAMAGTCSGVAEVIGKVRIDPVYKRCSENPSRPKVLPEKILNASTPYLSHDKGIDNVAYGLDIFPSTVHQP
jgi:hypothetical protein